MTNLAVLLISSLVDIYVGFPSGSVAKESTCNAGDLGLIPGLWRSLRGGHGNPPLAWRIPMNRETWRATYSLWGRKESNMTEQLSTYILMSYICSHFTLTTFRSCPQVQSCINLTCNRKYCILKWCISKIFYF